jgi:methyl-accepting chemotaxis protein
VIDPRGSLDEAVFVVHTPARVARRCCEGLPARPCVLRGAGLHASDGLVRDAAGILQPNASDPWALLRKTRADGWWVVAEVPDAEALASQLQVSYAVWGLMALALGLLAWACS